MEFDSFKRKHGLPTFVRVFANLKEIAHSTAVRNLMKVSPPETEPSQDDRAWFEGPKSA